MQRDDRVTHEKHGAGTVRRVAPDGVTVKFDGVAGIWIGPAAELKPLEAATRGRSPIKSEAMKQRQFRQSDETWKRWQALAKAAGLGGVRELMEQAVSGWEDRQPADVIERAEQMLELGVL